MTTAAAGIRPPAIAGTWYPGEAEALRRFLNRLLDEARAGLPPAESLERPKALIVPHAAYRFSGGVAARAYARVLPWAQEIRRVVLFGPCHRVSVNGLAIPSVRAFRTPLGEIPLDTANLDQLRARPGVCVSDEAHAPEHSLEIQLPMLQCVLGDFALTPVAVGRADLALVSDTLDSLWGGPETLIVISSDLSHYHAYDEAQRLDTAASMTIMALNPKRLVSRDACGWRGVNGLLACARRRGLVPETLSLLNSGDVRGVRDRVVGYGAWALSPGPGGGGGELDEAAQDQLLRVAATAVRRAATGRTMPAVFVGSFGGPLREPGASFVTLTRGGRLRGCLGSMRAYRPLVLDVAERGYAAATRDKRFPPLAARELDGLGLEVSILSPPEPLSFESEADLLAQLRPGVDGVILEDEGKRGTFLPKVWEEIPAADRFLMRLKQKAGLPPDHWSPTVRAWRYETQRFGMTLRPEARGPRKKDVAPVDAGDASPLGA